MLMLQYATSQKFSIDTDFWMCLLFEWLHLFDPEYSKHFEILQIQITVFYVSTL